MIWPSIPAAAVANAVPIAIAAIRSDNEDCRFFSSVVSPTCVIAAGTIAPKKAPVRARAVMRRSEERRVGEGGGGGRSVVLWRKREREEEKIETDTSAC